MKQYISICLFAACICFMTSCEVFQPTDVERVLSFWTDTILDDSTEYVLYINDIPSGTVREELLDPICHSEHLVDIPLVHADDMMLTVKTNAGDVYNLGIINLFDPASGIRIIPTQANAIFVQHDEDDACTRVRLRW